VMVSVFGPRTLRTASLALLGLILLLIGSTVADARPQDQSSSDRTVGIANFTFVPREVTVLVGATVTWTNPQDPVQHTTTSNDGDWDSGPLATVDSFAFTFGQPGDFAYACAIHPSMAGIVHVVSDANALPVPALAKVDAIANEVPPDVRAKGALQVATDATYAPNEFVDPADGQIKGWDIELGQAISTVLGLPFVVSNADFSAIIPGLGTRYDLSLSSFTPTVEREKTVDFVTYYQAGESWFTRVGGPDIAQAADLCSRTVAVETGTTEETDAWGFMGKKPDGSAITGDKDNCAAAGKGAITVHSYSKQTEANADVLGGRADVGWADQPVADYQVQLQSGQLRITGQACSVAPYGIALPKGSGMIKPLQDAIVYLIDKGYYAQILKKYGVTDGAIQSPSVALNNNDTVGAVCVPSY
jgi:polar amino acid transport system substrate-binding protein